MVCEWSGRNYGREKILADTSVYYIPGRDYDILDRNDQRVSDITATGNSLACAGTYMRLDSDCASGDVAYYYPNGKTGSEVREAACEAKCSAGRRADLQNEISDTHGAWRVLPGF